MQEKINLNYTVRPIMNKVQCSKCLGSTDIVIQALILFSIFSIFHFYVKPMVLAQFGIFLSFLINEERNGSLILLLKLKFKEIFMIYFSFSSSSQINRVCQFNISSIYRINHRLNILKQNSKIIHLIKSILFEHVNSIWARNNFHLEP
jgi:hypothetical protein